MMVVSPYNKFHFNLLHKPCEFEVDANSAKATLIMCNNDVTTRTALICGCYPLPWVFKQ